MRYAHRFLFWTMKERLKRILLSLASLLGLGVAYLLFVRHTGLGIPCVFYLLTGLYCPGCGISRMCLALARLDFSAAMGHNVLVFCLLPILIWLGLSKAVEYVKTGRTTRSKWETIFYLTAFALCVLFVVLRNMEKFAFLAP